jgi:drug/metabolite transporter (DMT)-like permease
MISQMNSHAPSGQMRAILLTALAAILWSTGGLAFRIAAADAWTMLFWRSAINTVVLFAGSVYLMRGRLRMTFRATLTSGLPVSVFLAMALILYVLSITNTTVADSLTVQAAGPLFIVVLGWVVLREPVRWITCTALVAVTIGILLILIPSIERGGLQGNVFGIAKALAFASAAIAIRRRRSVDTLPAVVLAAALATVVAALFAPSIRVSWRSFLALAYLGVFQTGLGYLLFAHFSGRIPSSLSGLLVLLESVFGPIWVWLFLGEVPAALTIVGGGLIISTLAVHTLLYPRFGSGPGRSADAEAPIRAGLPAPKN